MLRAALSMLAIGACLVGCEHEVFEHARTADLSHDAATDGAGNSSNPVDCTNAEPGTRCDDDNVCTPASTCRDRQCLAGTSSRDCILADADSEVPDEQGASGWHFGYWNADADADGYYDSETDFRALEHCGDGAWRPPEVCGLTRDDEGFRWTSTLGWALQHPETNPDLELPIRRFVSAVSGPARLIATHGVGGSASDGTRAILLLDGDELWRNDDEPADSIEAEMTFDVELRQGSTIDMLVHPIVTSADDTTYFNLRIEGR